MSDCLELVLQAIMALRSVTLPHLSDWEQLALASMGGIWLLTIVVTLIVTLDRWRGAPGDDLLAFMEKSGAENPEPEPEMWRPEGRKKR